MISRKRETQLGPPKGMAPGLRPAMMEGGDWTWRTTKEPPAVESAAGDRSLRLSRAHRRADMLSSLPSTATITHPRFPEDMMVDF